jgi:membrane protein YqaA with SNARE-associated domain
MSSTGDHPEPTHASPEPRRRPSVARRLYDWMLGWAGKPGGTAALAGITFAESSFFPIPPDPLLLALALGKPKRALWFAAVATLASVAGGIFGYWLGMFLWSSLESFFFTYVPGVSANSFTRVQDLYNAYDFWAVFMAGLTPLPYKVFTLASGVFKISFPIFVIASVVSRGTRFFMLAGLVYYFGPRIKGFIDHHFNKIAWGFAILLIGGFILIRYL